MAAERSKSIDRELGPCPRTERMISLKNGRFGPYVTRAVREGSKMKPRNAALLKGMEPDDVTLELAIKLLDLPKTLGNHPVSNYEIVVSNGRYGPYLKCGAETRSLPDDMSPIEITLEQAMLVLAQPKKSRKKSDGGRKKPVKHLGQSPVTEQGVMILVGKFGLYVTDGVTNASIPKEYAADEVTLDHALQLLENKMRNG